jgi:type I restriction enzyme S subunit
MALTISVTEIVEKNHNPLLGKHDSWSRIPLGEIAEVLNGFAFKSSQFNNEHGMPLIRIRDVGKNTIDTKYSGEYDATYVVKNGDLLVGMDGDFNCARWHGPDALLNQRVCKITLKTDKYLPRFLDYVLPGYLRVINEFTSSVTVKHLSSNTIKEIPLPFPAIDIQRKIVVQLDKQTSRLDEAVASLKRIQANLKRYKAAVLKAAVEGKLTEQWRKDHPDVEPAAQLLKRILAERRAKWEAEELAKMKTKGIKPKDDSWKKKYKQPAGPDTANLPELPEAWVWTSMDSIIVWGPQNGIYLPKSLYKPGIPILRIDDYQDGFSRSKDELRQVEASDKDKDTYSLEEADLVINRVNSLTHLGKCLVVKERNIPSLFESNMMRLRVASLIGVAYVEMYLRSKFGRTFLTGNAKWAVNQASINQDDVKNTPVPLPPLHEQHFILEEIDRRLSVTEELETTIETNLKRAERLRQTILQQAFLGGQP